MVMKKIKRSNSKEAKDLETVSSGSNINFNMSSVAVKKYDELIRCTNVITEGIEQGKNFTLFSGEGIKMSSLAYF